MPTTASAASLRIDTPVSLTSRMSTLIYISLVCVMSVLAWLAELSLWQYVLLLTIGVFVFGYVTLSKPILLHLTQPPVDQRVDRHWQLLLRTGRADELWQASLLSVHRYPLLIHLSFAVTTPYQRALTITIFHDQVSADQWRKLNMLACVLPTTSR